MTNTNANMESAEKHSTDMHVFRFSVDTAVWEFWKNMSGRKIRRWEVIAPMVLPRLLSEPAISSGVQSTDRQVIYWLVPKSNTVLIDLISAHSGHMRGMNRILTLAARDHGFKQKCDYDLISFNSFYYPSQENLPNYLAHHRWPKWLQKAIIQGAKSVDITMYADFDVATQKKHYMGMPPASVCRAMFSASRRLMLAPDVLFGQIVQTGLKLTEQVPE